MEAANNELGTFIESFSIWPYIYATNPNKHSTADESIVLKRGEQIVGKRILKLQHL